MEFKQTNFPFFYDECIKQFGYEEGKEISEIAERRLLEMKKEADYRNSKAIKRHMDINLLPTIAMYLAFKEVNFTIDEAYENTLEMAQIAARKMKEKNESLSKIPFFYMIFKVFCKFIMKNNFPIEGWDIEWKKCNKKEVHFNMKRCIYKETTEKYNCSELCPVFCANDVTTFSGYSPNIIFERQGTIGQGQNVCDFHFINAKFDN